MTDRNIPDAELRQSVGETFSIYEASVMISAIFMGFVYSGLLMLLMKAPPVAGPTYTASEEVAICFFVFATLGLVFGVILLQLTAHQVARRWSLFLPKSLLLTSGTWFFTGGLICMLLAVAFLLWSRDFVVLGWVVASSSLLTFLWSLWKVRWIHGRRAPYVREVGIPLTLPKWSKRDNSSPRKTSAKFDNPIT